MIAESTNDFNWVNTQSDFLPENIYENICDLENTLLQSVDKTIIENLARLYKQVVEYHSSSDPTKSSKYLMKLQILFSNKQVRNVMYSNPNLVITTNTRKQSYLNMEFGIQNIYSRSSKQAKTLLTKFDAKFNDQLIIIMNDFCNQEHSLEERLKKRKLRVCF